jgi:hypothetical protein
VDYEALLDGDFKVWDKSWKGLIELILKVNEGFAAPNTAELQVYDDKERWLLLVNGI